MIGNQYITNLQYSSDGKLIKQINPTGVITENNYTEFGALSEIKCNGQRVWKLNSLHPIFGNIDSYETANGVTNTSELNDLGLLQNQTAIANGQEVFNMLYTQ